MKSNLKIHIFGDGLGEAIFIEFPNKKVGIIDCGTKNFYEWFKVYCAKKSLQEIGFIIWTHPHEDHFKYLGLLLDFCEEKKISVNYFARFDYGNIKKVAYLIDRLELSTDNSINREELPENILRLLDNSPYIYFKEYKPNSFSALLDKIEKLKSKNIITNYIEDLKFSITLFDENVFCADTKVLCISPTQEDLKDYIEEHEKVAVKEGGIDSPNAKKFLLESGLHNKLSVALCLKYKDYNLIFGGDVEEESWERILQNDRVPAFTKSNIKFLKVSHHGSKGAYFKEAWDYWGNDFYAVITPFDRPGLPKRETITLLKSHINEKNIIILKNNYYKKQDTSKVPTNKLMAMMGTGAFKETSSKYKDMYENNDLETNHVIFTIGNNGKISYSWG